MRTIEITEAHHRRLAHINVMRKAWENADTIAESEQLADDLWEEFEDCYTMFLDLSMEITD